jgi:HK97 family phage portal protein
MAIGSWIRGLFGTREKADGSPDGVLLAKLMASASSPRKGRAELLAAYHYSPWLRAIIGRLGRDVATAFRPVLFDKPEWDPSRKRIYKHPLLDLLYRPHQRLPRRAVYAVNQQGLDLIGEGFLVIDRNSAGFPAMLSPAPGTWISEIATDAFPFYRLKPSNGVARLIDERDMVWVRDPDPANPYGRGVGLAEACADELDTDEGAAKLTKAFFENGGMPSWLIQLEGAGDPEVDSFQTFIRAKYQGSKKAHQIHITNKPMKAERIDTSFRDMSLTELRKWERDVVVQVLGVPPELIGILENSNRATSEGAYYRYAKGVIVPRLDLLVDELQAKLVPQFGGDLWLGYENPIPEDRDFFIRAVATAPAAFRVREVRERVGGLLPDAEIDNERLSTVPVVAGPTNVPPGKGIAAPTESDPPWARQSLPL